MVTAASGINLPPAIGAFGFGIALAIFRRTRWIGVGVLIGTAPGMAFMEFLIAMLVLWAPSI
jgi:hypothetical protein